MTTASPSIFVGATFYFKAAQHRSQAVGIQELVYPFQWEGWAHHSATPRHYVADRELCPVFLYIIDFEALGRGNTAHHLTWLSIIKSARSATFLAEEGLLAPQALEYFSSQSQRERTLVDDKDTQVTP